MHDRRMAQSWDEPSGDAAQTDRLTPLLIGYGLIAGLFGAACWLYVRGPRPTVDPSAVPGVWTWTIVGAESAPPQLPAFLIGSLLGVLAGYFGAQSLKSLGFFLKRGARGPVWSVLVLFGVLGLLVGFASYANLAVNSPRRVFTSDTVQPLIIDADPIWVTIPGVALAGSLLFGLLISLRWRLVRTRPW